MSATRYSVPLAESIAESPDQPGETGLPGQSDQGPGLPKPCVVSLPDGCYRIAVKPLLGTGTYRGTLRVDRGGGALVVSGDLYWFPLGTDDDGRGQAVSRALLEPIKPPGFFRRHGIPVYPRNRYHSYLKATSVRLVSLGTCRASVAVEQYDYTQPAAGTFNGSFPAAPGSRTATLRFAKKPAPSFLWPGNYYEGEWVENGVVTGSATLGWVSASLRRCTIEIDTLVDAVSPQPVPALGAAGTESFKTMMASAGWAATVVYDQKDIPKPATVANHKACWSDADLHALMQSVRKAGTDLDADWRMHVMVVPGKMPCSRGKMYDSITVPREGVVSYSDDGYPVADSVNFGAAANQTQRTVPRAFLRSASHEVVHGFNQIHQEQEGGADNSIMTTTPSVADVLAAPGDPGVFPDDIKLKVNANVRHHLAHFPDPVVRPGGHTFASWAMTPVPSADRLEVGPELLTLRVSATDDRVELGEPVQLRWTLANTGGADAAVPSEVTAESTYAKITVIDAAGRRREMTPFVIDCERSRIAPLEAGGTLTAEARVFWSGNGFAFERPGRYTVEVRVDWTVAGTPMTVRGETPVFVNYPASDTENAAAAALLHPEVGKWVALGGGAYHLGDAVDRLRGIMAAGDGAGDGAAPGVKALRGYSGILPDAQ
ncbi:hypothetical protein [Amycolatopsis sp. MtRt-6]|uniref:hypothetical protein n=1 Tax=Amycolatopsis sp. MtRt-6 TaxID=2792782 RepID=UPI001A8C53EE|nr:hypothetical protein [Amycolatopsis sp. MtRt-6]